MISSVDEIAEWMSLVEAEDEIGEDDGVVNNALVDVSPAKASQVRIDADDDLMIVLEMWIVP